MIRLIFGKIVEDVTFLGGVVFYVLFSLWFLFTKDYHSFIILMAGLGIIYLAAGIIRMFYFKARPAKMIYTTSLEKLDASSFPSVHAARITLLSAFFISKIPGRLLLIFLTVLLAVFVCYSRIYLKKHYLTDILGGLVLGILVYLLLILL